MFELDELLQMTYTKPYNREKQLEQVLKQIVSTHFVNGNEKLSREDWMQLVELMPEVAKLVPHKDER